VRHVFAVALGGAAGSLCRYAANLACARWMNVHSTVGTTAVNVVGCLLIGCLAASRLREHLWLSDLAAVGFLGGLTTFSTFGLETVRLLQSGHSGHALLNVAANVLAGFAAVAGGMQLAERMGW
jgi:CrcB protein